MNSPLEAQNRNHILHFFFIIYFLKQENVIYGPSPRFRSENAVITGSDSPARAMRRRRIESTDGRGIIRSRSGSSGFHPLEILRGLQIH